MRKIEFNVYAFDELSDEAKKNAVEENRYSMAEFHNEDISSDYNRSLEKFKEVFDVCQVDIDEYGHSIRWRSMYQDETIFSYDGRTDEPIYLRELTGASALALPAKQYLPDSRKEVVLFVGQERQKRRNKGS